MTSELSENFPTDTQARLSIPKEEEVFVFPASFAQQRLWFIDQLVPGNSFYKLLAAAVGRHSRTESTHRPTETRYTEPPGSHSLSRATKKLE